MSLTATVAAPGREDYSQNAGNAASGTAQGPKGLRTAHTALTMPANGWRSILQKIRPPGYG